MLDCASRLLPPFDEGIDPQIRLLICEVLRSKFTDKDALGIIKATELYAEGSFDFEYLRKVAFLMKDNSSEASIAAVYTAPFPLITYREFPISIGGNDDIELLIRERLGVPGLRLLMK